MKISLCITVLNEEQTISRLLDSVFAGTKKPDEIVIVDGGSKDGTLKVIGNYQKAHKNIRLFTKRGGIAIGRNYSIKNAKGNIIVQTDAGCVVRQDWLTKITQPFSEKKVDIVAGFYEMKAATPLQEAINVFHGTSPERFDAKKFIPSARSVAFRKQVWKKVGGYSEKLKNTGEDTLFFYEVQKFNFNVERVGDARVIWEETANLALKKSLVKFFNYAKGDVKTGIWWDPAKQLMSHNIKVVLIVFRYATATLLILSAIFNYISPLLPIFLIVVYTFWPIYKWRDEIKSTRGRIWLPLIQISSDMAVMAGFLYGILEKK